MGRKTAARERLLGRARFWDLFGRVVLFVEVGFVTVGVAAWLRPSPRVYATAELSTELVRLDVVDPRKSAFYIAGVRIGALGEAAGGECVSGLFTPVFGASMTFGRTARGPLEIELAPPPAEMSASRSVGVLEGPDAAAPVSYGGAIVMLTDPACKPPAVQRLPLWGPLRVGQEFRPASDREAPVPSFLLGGKLEVAAHTVWHDTPYQVTTVTIPVGARLQADDPEQAEPVQRAIWWGTATVDSEHSALDLALATEAQAVALFRPNQTRADVIRLSVLTEMTKDPSYLLFALFLGFGLFVFEKCLGMAEFWQKVAMEERSRGEDE